jgi:hypothetical protein
VVGSCECGDDPMSSGATDLVSLQQIDIFCNLLPNLLIDVYNLLMQ